jgi:hypothetical protein
MGSCRGAHGSPHEGDAEATSTVCRRRNHAALSVREEFTTMFKSTRPMRPSWLGQRCCCPRGAEQRHRFFCA